MLDVYVTLALPFFRPHMGVLIVIFFWEMVYAVGPMRMASSLTVDGLPISEAQAQLAYATGLKIRKVFGCSLSQCHFTHSITRFF